jgi:poly(hydroxyalkanoate) granule-associated protein
VVALNFPTFLEFLMVTKLQKSKTSKKAAAPLSGSVKDSAQQIWQAGVGAFSKAQAEGTKAIEALIKEGVSMQRKTQSVAEGKISEASSKMSSMATDISSKASGQWDKLESIFEDRVAKALNKLGVPSAKDITALIARIDDLNKSVQKLSAKGAAAKAVPKKAAKAAPAKKSAGPAKPVAKRASARKTAKPVAVVAGD